MRRGAFAPDFKNYTFGIVFQFSIDCLRQNFVSFFSMRRVFRTHVETPPLRLNLSPSFADFRSVSVKHKRKHYLHSCGAHRRIWSHTGSSHLSFKKSLVLKPENTCYHILDLNNTRFLLSICICVRHSIAYNNQGGISINSPDHTQL